MSDENRGPLGPLTGMYFNPERNRYFPIPPEGASVAPINSSASGAGPSRRREGHAVVPATSGCPANRTDKRRKVYHPTDDLFDTPPRRPRTGRMVQRQPGDGSSYEEAFWSSMSMDVSLTCGEGCSMEQITSIRSFCNGTAYGTTLHGQLILMRGGGVMHGMSICASPLVGLHFDMPRMTVMAVAAGPEPHIHHFRRDPENLDHIWMQQTEIELDKKPEIYCMSSFDNSCVLGSARSLVKVDYDTGPCIKKRTVKSDVMAIHQYDPNLIIAGLRNGFVSLEDLRVDGKNLNKIGHTVKGKAVVGVKRLSDTAVPWGVVISGLDSELLLYDVRFPTSPMLTFPGHHNRQYSDLGLATTLDGKYLFAAGTDNRIRLYSTQKGTRLGPNDAKLREGPEMARYRVGPKEKNPLRRVFDRRITALSVREDGFGLDVGSGGSMFQFSATGDMLQAEGEDGEGHEDEYDS